MPKLYVKQSVKPQIVVETPKISERKSKVITKLNTELEVTKKALVRANNKVDFFHRRYEGTPSHYSETQYGSSIAEHLFTRSQDKYHQVKWDTAVKAINRRIKYLKKLIAIKTKSR
jgi:hypothetical protein